MTRWTWERLAASSGLVFIALIIISSAIFQPPVPTSSAGKITTYFVHHHRAGLVSGVLGAVSVIFFLWLIGSLAATLRAAGELRLASIAFGAAVATVATALFADAVETSIAYRVALDSPGSVQALYDVTMIGFTLIFFPLAALAAATAIAVWRTKVLPQWYAGLSAIGTVLFVSGGATVQHAGFYSPQKGWAWVPFIAFGVWTLLTTGLLMQRAAETTTVSAAVPA